MTSGESVKRVHAPKSWDGPSKPVHSIANLRDILTQITKQPEGMSEVVIEDQKPVVIRHTETDNIIVEISAAYKSAMMGGTTTSTSVGDEKTQLKTLFKELDAPAITTEEVADRIGCLPSEATDHLIELEHRGWIDHRQSGDTTLWWPKEETAENKSDDLEIFPDYLRQALEQSEKDIRKWIQDNQKEGESMKETYERIRGNPTPDEEKELLKSDDSKASKLLAQIRKKREGDKERKNDLKNLFK